MRRLASLLLRLVILVSMTANAGADEFKPAYLQLSQRSADIYDVLWKIPAIDESTTLGARPQFPVGTEVVGEIRSTYARGTTVQHWRIRVPGGLDGKAIGFRELSRTRIDVLARLVRLDGTVQLERVLPIHPEFVARPSPGPLEVMTTYTVLGVEHILGGFDHLLFVLALVLLVQGGRRLVATISAFTAAHSLTLAGATLGWVHVPGPPVEASVALSIMFVASEVVHAGQGRTGLTQRYPWTVAFAFGLLHGFGFAGALAEVGLPSASIPIALLCFNVGVEVGQLLFVAAVLACTATSARLLRRLSLPLPPWLLRVPPYAIGATAAFWLFERLATY